MATISETLRAAIRDSEVSLRDLGEATGIDHSQLSRFARGDRGLTIACLDRLADHFGLVLTRRPPGKSKR